MTSRELLIVDSRLTICRSDLTTKDFEGIHHCQVELTVVAFDFASRQRSAKKVLLQFMKNLRNAQRFRLRDATTTLTTYANEGASINVHQHLNLVLTADN